MASGRMHNQGEIHMVTNRCEEGRFFLKPTKEVTELIQYWFARAMEKYGSGLEIYAFCFLCNHFHMLCRDSSGNLARFMEYFQGNVAKAINEALGRGPAHFWQGHYDDKIIEGERTFWQKYLYIITNAVKSGLVARTAQWKGFCSFKAALAGRPVAGIGVNRTRYHNANRGEKKRPVREFVECFEFTLAVPPGLESMTPKELSREVSRLVRTAERHYSGRRENKAALGMERVLRISSFHRPKAPERLPRRLFECDSKHREKERIEEYRQFIAVYKRVYADFRSASLRGFRFHGEWPRGSLPPSCNQPVLYDLAA